MYRHLESIEFMYGENAHVQIPNDIYKTLSSHIKNKNGSTKIQQSSFAYSYTIMIAFLYKYTFYVDVDKETYIQNADIKELLGYNRNTKSIDHIIKKDGLLDFTGLTKTIKDYPVSFATNNDEQINEIPIREFTTINSLDKTDDEYKKIKKVVKNRNYEIKEPVFLFEYNDDLGTLYEYSNTHKVTIKEFMKFLDDEELNNIDFSIYCFIKSKCAGLAKNTKAIGLHIITSEIGISKDAFYAHLDILKKKGYIEVKHKGWTVGNFDCR